MKENIEVTVKIGDCVKGSSVEVTQDQKKEEGRGEEAVKKPQLLTEQMPDQED